MCERPDSRTIERELVSFFEQAGGTVWRDYAEPFMHAAKVFEDDHPTSRHGDHIKRGEHVSLEQLARRLADLWK